LQDKLNKLTMRECEKRLRTFFETGGRGVLASVQVDQQEKICPIATEGVRAEVCLRRLIQHPAMCDSRGLERLNDVIEELGLRMRKVGEQGRHILITSPGHLCFTFSEDDERLKRWDPTREGFQAMESPEGGTSQRAKSTDKRSGSEGEDDADRNARSKSRRSSAKTGGGETHDRAGSGMGCGDEWDTTEMQEDPQ